MNLQHHQKGFTLLEILIAMGITGIVIVLMSVIYINATRLWLTTDVHMKAQQKVRELLSGDPKTKVEKRGENVPWQGILNEFQDMCILLPAYPGGTSTLATNKVRFAIDAYIQDGGDNVCQSVPATIEYAMESGTQSISDIQVGTSGLGARSIFIICGEDGRFRSIPGDMEGGRADIDGLVEVASTDDVLYGRIINGNDGIISTTNRNGSDDVLTGNVATGSIRTNPGQDRRLQTILGDNNGDGNLLGADDQRNPDEYIVGDVISYEFNATNKTITRVVNDDLSTAKIIGTDIAKFSLSYYDTANNLLPETATTTSVKQIGGIVTVALPKKFRGKSGTCPLDSDFKEYATYTLTFKVHPRRLNPAFGGM